MKGADVFKNCSLRRVAIATSWLALLAMVGCANPKNQYAMPKATPETTTIRAVGDGSNGSWALSYHHDIVVDMSYMTNGRVIGVMEGSFTVDPPPVDEILAEAKRQRFDELPERIAPAAQPLHAPMYRLQIRFDKGMHEVQVYCPGCMERTAELDRFWAVWDKVWAPFKLKPTGFERFGPPSATEDIKRLQPAKETSNSKF